MFMVSIPGLNDWAVNLEREQISVSQDMEMAEVSDNSTLHVAKHSLNEEENKMEAEPSKKLKTLINSNAIADGEAENKTGLSREYLLNSPIVDRPSNACIAKFYEDNANLALNDIIEVIGFVSLEENLCASNRQPDEFENYDELCAMNPPPSLISRIHVISQRRLTHLNPLLYDNNTCSTQEEKVDSFQYMRKVLAQCLFGDEIAADYLLCHLISTVYVRGDETLGQFSLNITNFPSENLSSYIKSLYEIIDSCLPASHYFPITVDNLNTTEFVPK